MGRGERETHRDRRLRDRQTERGERREKEKKRERQRTQAHTEEREGEREKGRQILEREIDRGREVKTAKGDQSSTGV